MEIQSAKGLVNRWEVCAEVLGESQNIGSQKAYSLSDVRIFSAMPGKGHLTFLHWLPPIVKVRCGFCGVQLI